MTKSGLDALKYPIGKFQKPGKITPEIIKGYISDIETFPARLKKAVNKLDDEMLDTPYRPGGWTVRQVTHHMGHSHMNGFIRLKWALTENIPLIKPYYEKRWVKLPDTLHAPVAPSLKLVESLHASWVVLLNSLKTSDFKKMYLHPDGNVLYTLAESTGLYAWHSNHHLAHITSLKKRMGWK